MDVRQAKFCWHVRGQLRGDGGGGLRRRGDRVLGIGSPGPVPAAAGQDGHPFGQQRPGRLARHGTKLPIR